MVKLKRYIAPYRGYIAALIILLLFQSVVDLRIPDLMSDIVNVGIQHNGISDIVPEAVSAGSLELISRLLPEEDRTLVLSGYVPVGEAGMNDREQKAFLHKWPAAETQNVLCLRSVSDAVHAQLSDAFSRAACTAVALIGDHPSAGADTGGSSSGLPDFLAGVSQEEIGKAAAKALHTEPAMADQMALVLTRSIYTELGADPGKIQTRYILSVGGDMLLMTLILAACAIGVGFCSSRLGTGAAHDLRRDLFAHITEFTSAEFDRFGTASLITRTTNDVMQVRSLLSMGLRTICYAPIMGIGGIVMALRKSPGMAWIIALAGIIIFGVIFVLFCVAVPRFKIMQKLMDRLNLVSREMLSGMPVVRAFGAQDFEEERFGKANRELADNNLFVFRAVSAMMPIIMLIMNGVTLMIVWVGGRQIAAATIQVGDMMAFIQYTMLIIMSFLMISMVFVMLPRAAVSIDRINEVFSTECSIRDPETPRSLPEKVRGEIQFHDVSFRYPGAGEDVLEHISFTARPGETTAVIGPTGCGKSTLVSLIPRFCDVTSGSITLDGIDIRSLRQSDLRSVIGYMPQNGILFSGNIASNLRFGAPDADDAALRRAAETAQAAEFIDALPGGFSAPVSQGGTNVSGGQRQRLSIARAMVRRVPVYIFDDTFSALDFKTDARLRRAISVQAENSVRFIVAQRISTIMNAEQIIVLDEGRIAGIGTHRELLKSCSAYREIAQSQLSKEELQ